MFLLDSPTDGLIILVIVLISGLLGFWQERGAAGAVARMLQTAATTIGCLLTGAATQFAAIAERLRQRSPETDFERGVRRFGALLLELTLVLVITIFAVNVILQRPVPSTSRPGPSSMRSPLISTASA
ncbi:hypothetical protein VB734_10360 [Synechococcus sp. BA-124 BA4]|uniref:hypothetical protein n=1 Tax=unclassified Synechococcus TaxID=2626047 RepID=UPI0018CFB03D|nr:MULTISPECIES: hypothetical protein [unclassified Synechococcus]MEA5400439.1 hypothetical protein [Synechococcus sp. BA-124 BA4]CAK6688707.1 hypothetical protein BBFGKLBO_00470 [Synechococcus sp. CBW1107]